MGRLSGLQVVLAVIIAVLITLYWRTFLRVVAVAGLACAVLGVMAIWAMAGSR